MDFDKSLSRKICEWNSSSQLWHRELQFLVAREGRQPQWCVSRIFKTCRVKSQARLTRFEQCQNEGWTFKHASGNRCLHDTGIPSLLEKQQRRQRRQQQSYVTKSKSKIWDSHLQVCHEYGSTPWSRWTRNRWSGALGWCTLSIEREIPKSNGERVHGRGLAPLPLSWTRFGICKDENGELRYIRSIQGHSGGMIISPRLMNHVMIPFKWKRVPYHVGRARHQCSIAEIGLVAGGKERKKGRQSIFFTPLDPFNSDADEAESITDLKKQRKVQYQIHWSSEQDAVYWIHLSTAQDAGLEFWQTGSNAIITYQSVPKESVVKIVSESGKRELFARQLTPRERPIVTLRRSWVHTRDPILQTWLGKPRVICRPETPIWNHQRVAIGRTRTSNSLSISESTASPATRPKRTSNTCKELQNKFRNLWLRKKY